MARVTGEVSIANLPRHRGIMVSLCFFKVPGAESSPPDVDRIDPRELRDIQLLAKEVDLERDSRRIAFLNSFEFHHPEGFFYLQLRVVLFRKAADSVAAQAEQFLFNRRPLEIHEGLIKPVLLSVSWPSTPLGELHRHASFYPEGVE